MAEFRMPTLGADMDQGTLVEWRVAPGDTVRKGDIIAVVDTSKAAVEVECFDTGIIDRLLIQPGQTVPVGTPLATISTGAEGAPSGPALPAPTTERPQRTDRKRPAVPPPVRKFAAQHGIDLTTLHGSGRGGAITHADVDKAIRQQQPQPAAATAAVPAAPARKAVPRHRVSPYARRLAAELHVDLEQVNGSGADGAVRASDVRAAIEYGEPAPAAPTRRESMREAIAHLMARSKREIPHYYLTSVIDLAHALDWMHERNRRASVADRLVPAALLLKATALAAQEVADLNGHWIDDHLMPADSVHLGVAVSLRGGGLIAPTIPNAAEIPLTDLMHQLRDLVARARANRLRSADTTEATITVTSLGELGVDSVHGVIYPPQVALVGFGAVTHRPWVVDGLIGIRPLVTATLSGDHRATDGATGARLLNLIDTSLQHPEAL